MALNRPGFVRPPDANTGVLTSDNKFLKFKDGEAKMLRFLPAPKEDGVLFYPVANHYGLKNQDGREIALSCRHKHEPEGTGGRCLICDVRDYLLANYPDNALVAGPNKDGKGLQAQTRYYTQVLEAHIVDRKVTGWSSPKLVAWSQTAANGIQTIFTNQQEFGTPLAYDIDQGQALIVKRTGTGFQTKYPAERTGDMISLDVIRPTWATEFITDMYEQIGLNLADLGMQAAYLRVTDPKLPWEDIFQAIGFDEDAA